MNSEFYSIPIGFILIQFFNFFLFISLLVYFSYKKVLPILKKQKDSFLLSQQMAIEAETNSLKLLKKWEKDIQKLEEKKKTLDQQIKQALKNQKIQWEKKEERQCYILSQEVKRDFDQQKYQKFKALKNQVWDLVLLKAKVDLNKLSVPEKEKINQRVVYQLNRFEKTDD